MSQPKPRLSQPQELQKLIEELTRRGYDVIGPTLRIEGKRFEIGAPMSVEVKSAVNAVVRRIANEIHR